MISRRMDFFCWERNRYVNEPLTQLSQNLLLFIISDALSEYNFLDLKIWFPFIFTQILFLSFFNSISISQTIEDFILLIGTIVAFIAFVLWCCFPIQPKVRNFWPIHTHTHTNTTFGINMLNMCSSDTKLEKHKQKAKERDFILTISFTSQDSFSHQQFACKSSQNNSLTLQNYLKTNWSNGNNNNDSRTTSSTYSSTKSDHMKTCSNSNRNTYSSCIYSDKWKSDSQSFCFRKFCFRMIFILDFFVCG